MNTITKTKIISAKNPDALLKKVQSYTFRGDWHPFGEKIEPFTLGKKQRSFRQQIVCR